MESKDRKSYIKQYQKEHKEEVKKAKRKWYHENYGKTYVELDSEIRTINRYTYVSAQSDALKISDRLYKLLDSPKNVKVLVDNESMSIKIIPARPGSGFPVHTTINRNYPYHTVYVELPEQFYTGRYYFTAKGDCVLPRAKQKAYKTVQAALGGSAS